MTETPKPPLQDALKHYGEQKIILASPVKQVSMLYDEAIRQLNIALQSIEEKKIEQRWRANTRATEIIHHMLSTLDKEKGGEVAENLERLFIYILQRLPAVDLENSQTAAKDVINLLTPLAKSWRVLANQSPAEIEKGVSQALSSHHHSQSVSRPHLAGKPSVEEETEQEDSARQSVAISV